MKLGFLGFGNLARAMVSGLKIKNAIKPNEICICAKSDETRSYAEKEGYNVLMSAAELFNECDNVILAIKPKIFRELSQDLKKSEYSGKKIISLMAAVNMEELKNVFGCPILRLMPSLAMAIADDIIGYYTDDDGFDDIKEILSKLGTVMTLNEEMLDKLTVTYACGLGFSARIMKIYSDECIKMGFMKEDSDKISASVFANAAMMQPFDELEQRVATKGGATEAGLLAMDENARKSVSSAFSAAFEKAKPKK